VNIKIHVVELVSDFLGLEFVTVIVEDLGEEEWYEEHNDSKSKGPSLVINVSVDGLRMPDRELGSAGNDNLDETDIN